MRSVERSRASARRVDDAPIRVFLKTRRENADCLPVANRRARRRFEKGLRRSSEGRRGGRASVSARTFHGVGSSAARARGRGGGRDGGRAPRGEARDARLRGAGDAARAGGHHAFNELGFFRAGVRVESRGEATERASRGYANATRGGTFPRRRDAGVQARVEVSFRGARLVRYYRRFRGSELRRFLKPSFGRFLSLLGTQATHLSKVEDCDSLPRDEIISESCRGRFSSRSCETWS